MASSLVALRVATPADFDDILAVVNDASIKYKGVIPDDAWKEPYMPADELRHQIDEAKVVFHVAALLADATEGGDKKGLIVGVMGIQERTPDPSSAAALPDGSDPTVTLIRHAYVRTRWQGRGIGRALLEALIAQPKSGPLLLGTWTAGEWAVRFYERNGFELVDGDSLQGEGKGTEKDRLLRLYWFCDAAGVDSTTDPYRKKQMPVQHLCRLSALHCTSMVRILIPA